MGWKTDSRLTVKLSRAAVQSRVLPLYEVESGESYRLTVNPDGVPVADHLGMQGRFSHLGPDEVAAVQRDVDNDWRRFERILEMKAPGGAESENVLA